jgi:hypothetical protein
MCVCVYRTELVGLAATETPNPRKTMPSAIKNTFWRITIIYIVSLLIIGFAVPHNDPRLFDGSGADISPFVIVMDKARIGGLNRELFSDTFITLPQLLSSHHQRRELATNSHSTCLRPYQYYHLHIRPVHRSFLRIRRFKNPNRSSRNQLRASMLYLRR